MDDSAFIPKWVYTFHQGAAFYREDLLSWDLSARHYPGIRASKQNPYFFEWTFSDYYKLETGLLV